MVKLFVLALAFASLSSHSAIAASSVYRIYEGKIKTLAQESKDLVLKVNSEVMEHRLGDPEIEDHGFIKKYLEVEVSEGRTSCTQVIYLEEGAIRLCSGSRLQLEAPQSILSEKQIKGSLLMNGFRQPIGEASMSLIEVKSVEDELDDLID